MASDLHTTDALLLKEWSHGRYRQAFEEIVRRHTRAVYSTCLRQLTDPHLAEDATQVTFMILFKKASGLSPRTHLADWLYHTALNVSRNLRRHETLRARRGAKPMEEMEETAMSAEPETEDLAALWEQVKPHLDKALPALPRSSREAVLLHYLEGRTLAETAQELNCTPDALRMRLSYGIKKLRDKLKGRGVVVGLAALATMLGSSSLEAAPAGLAGKVTGTLFAAGLAESVRIAGLTKAVMKMMVWVKVKAAAGVTLAVLAVMMGAVGVMSILVQDSQLSATAPQVVASASITPKDRAIPEESPDEKPRDILETEVVVRTYDGREVFYSILPKAGVRVFGMSMPQNFLVPPEMRFRPTKIRELVEAIAARKQLKVVWLNGGHKAILQKGVTNREIEVLRQQLTSKDVEERRYGAWRAGWMKDVRVVPLIVEAADDIDSRTARWAIESLNRLGWSSAFLLDERAWELAEKKGVSKSSVVTALGWIDGEKALTRLERILEEGPDNQRWAAISALGDIGGESARKAMPLVEEVLKKTPLDNRDWKVATAIMFLGNVGGERALTLLEKILDEPDVYIRSRAATALGEIGGERALALLEKALKDPESNVRINAFEALGEIGGEKALAMLERIMEDDQETWSMDAVESIGRIGGEKSWALIEKAMKDDKSHLRIGAVQALGQIGGEKALALLEKAIEDKDSSVRAVAVSNLFQVDDEKALEPLAKALEGADDRMKGDAVGALRKIGGEKVLPLLAKVLEDPQANMRSAAASSLGEIGGERALALLGKALEDANSEVRMGAVSGLGNFEGEKAFPLWEKALKDTDPKVRGMSVLRGQWIGGEKVQELLLAQIETEKDDNVKKACISLLGKQFQDDPRVQEVIKAHPLPQVPMPPVPAWPLTPEHVLATCKLAVNKQTETSGGRLPRFVEDLMGELAGPDPAVAQALLKGEFEMADLLGRKLEKIEAPETTPLIYESAPKEGKRWVLYVDGTVKQLVEETFLKQRKD